MHSFPFYKQLESSDCGPSCLRMISKYYGKNFGLEYLRRISFISKKGVSLLGLSEASETIGFHAIGAKITWDQLVEEVPLPCIVHWNQSHFVVVYKIKKKSTIRLPFARKSKTVSISVADPAYGLIKYSKDDFLNHWINPKEKMLIPQGAVLLLEPTPKFYLGELSGEKKPISLGFILKYFSPYKNYIFQLFIGLLTGSLLSLAFPFLTQSVVDYGISNEDVNFIILVLVAQLILTLSQTFNSLIQNWITLHVTSRISISLIAAFLAKLMRLPMSFFDSRSLGDTIQRINDHGRIQSFITGTLVSILFSIITILSYSVIMWHYNSAILGIFFFGTLLYLFWVSFFLKKRRELDFQRFQQSSFNDSNLYELVTGMQDIRLNGAELQKRWQWERIQTKLYKISIRGLSLTQFQVIGSTFIDQAKGFIISFLAAKSVVSGEITLGMMMAIQYIIGQLNAPIQQTIGFVQSAQDAKMSLERLNEIHNLDDEEKTNARLEDVPNEINISIRDLTFQYEGPNSEKVLDSITCEIPAKKVTAIVGTSGSGKSTLLRILLAVYKPVSGNLLINGLPFDNYQPSAYRRRCGVVMQDGYIFSDTIANNISLGEEYPDMHRIRESAAIANVSNFIEALPSKYTTIIGKDGTGLSSGQRQRILIARALYKDANLLLFDEATNSLDSKNEREIIDKLDILFKNRTVVIIAHRLSTIKKADQIIVLEKGKIVEMGTHSELLSLQGHYFDLIRHQL